MRMQTRLSVKLMVWTAALLAPAQATVALDCPCNSRPSPSISEAHESDAAPCCTSDTCHSHRHSDAVPHVVGGCNSETRSGRTAFRPLHPLGTCHCPPGCSCEQSHSSPVSSANLGNERTQEVQVDLVSCENLRIPAGRKRPSTSNVKDRSFASGSGLSLCLTLCRLTV